jgi:outer membrane protein assembly factor BamB
MSNMRQLGLCLAIVALLLTGADWNRFRGPGASGVSEDTGLPIKWSGSDGVAWKTALPGFGASSPITLGEQVFVTSYSGYGLDRDEPGEQANLRYHLTCLDRSDGRMIWSASIKPNLPRTEYSGFVPLHGYSSGTPVTDGQSVYTFFGNSGVCAFDLAGKPFWKASVGDGLHKWGSGTSLILHNDLLIVSASIESKSIVALNKATGEEVWRTGGIQQSWGTPLIIEAIGGGQELVVSYKGTVVGLEPTTGKQLWECASVNDYICPSVIGADGIVYITGGRTALTIAVRTGGRGDVTETHRLWELKKTPKVATPVYYDGYLYWLGNKGIACCVDAKTGKVIYEERMRIPGSGDKVYASGVMADGKLYYVTRQSGTIVLAAGTEFDQLAQNELDDDSVFNATPVVSNSQLLIRSDRFLYCVGK